MALCGEIITYMRKIAPYELAEEWDNIGLLVGSANRDVKKILLSLDITTASLDEAVKQKADMIITHHPVIFKGIKNLNEDKCRGKLLSKLIRNNICVYTAHTNLDYADSGVNAQLAAVIGITNPAVMGKGPGLAGTLNRNYNFDEFIGHVKQVLDIPYVRVVGERPSRVRKAAVFSGSFDDDIEAVLDTGADVLVTGEVKYHTALEVVDSGICIIEAGHYNTEKVVLPYLIKILQEEFPNLEFVLYRQDDPFITC